MLVTVALMLVAVALMGVHLLPGLTSFAVKSGSMEPSLPVGSMILVQQVSAQRVREGDVITFHLPGATTPVTHRVVERSYREGQWHFRTRGDANPADDRWPAAEGDQRRVAGALVERDGWVTYGRQPAQRLVLDVPHLGSLSLFLGNPVIRALLTALLTVLVAWRVLRVIWVGQRLQPVAGDGGT